MTKDYARRCFFFFFSSRRRHTRFSRDWSSDVCSSDLGVLHEAQIGRDAVVVREHRAADDVGVAVEVLGRSEERRVGKECRAGWGSRQRKKKRGWRMW